MQTAAKMLYLVIPETREVIDLLCGDDGLYRDGFGTVYSIEDQSASSKDNFDGCGIRPFAVPNPPAWMLRWFPGLCSWIKKLNDACKPHDHIYNSKAAQRLFGSRAVADAYLRNLVELAATDPRTGKMVGWGGLGKPFEKISNKLGGDAWEDDETR